jgi:hypothetical protein
MVATLVVIQLRISARRGVSTQSLRTPDSRVADKVDYQHWVSLLLIFNGRNNNTRTTLFEQLSNLFTVAGRFFQKEIP